MSKHPLKQKYELYIILCVLVFWWAAHVASAHLLDGFELHIFRLVNGLPQSLWIPLLMITELGSIWMLFGVTLLLLWAKQNRLALRVFCGGAIAYFLTEAFKYAVARPRPILLIADIHLRQNLQLGLGFPSGHTAIATAVALLLMPYVPKRWRWLCILWPLLVGVSRVYLGVHSPYDVLGGWAVGLAVVSASLLIRNKLKFVRKITHLKLSD